MNNFCSQGNDNILRKKVDLQIDNFEEENNSKMCKECSHNQLVGLDQAS